MSNPYYPGNDPAAGQAQDPGAGGALNGSGIGTGPGQGFGGALATGIAAGLTGPLLVIGGTALAALLLFLATQTFGGSKS